MLDIALAETNISKYIEEGHENATLIVVKVTSKVMEEENRYDRRYKRIN